MSNPRHSWWDTAIKMIQKYPGREEKLKALRGQSITPNMSGMPKSGGSGRTTENIATRQLPHEEQKEYDAVLLAKKRTKNMADAKLRMDVVRMTLWGGYKIGAAALRLNISERTARRYRWQFILLVGRMYGSINEEEYQTALKKDMPT